MAFTRPRVSQVLPARRRNHNQLRRTRYRVEPYQGRSMSDEHAPVVPVWTLSTSDAQSVPAIAGEDGLTADRLSELRLALATFSSVPLVTLEAHPLPKNRERATGLPLDAVSPLAQELSRLVATNASSTPAVAQLAESGEVLYRMVVPAKVAAQVGKGLVKPMSSQAVATGVYDNLVDTTTKLVTAKATFVPVQSAAAGAAGTAVGSVAAGTATTVAAPLIPYGGRGRCERVCGPTATEGDRAHR